MKIVGLAGSRVAELQTVPEPELLPGSLVVEISYCGIGGSDLEAWQHGSVPHLAWFGHEWSGRVVGVGPEVKDHFEGERVVGAVGPSCGSCPPCGAGFGAHCRTALRQIVGADGLASDHGAFAEQIRVDHRRVLRIPDGVDDKRAALAEPAAVALHAIGLGRPSLGDTVVVVGAGTIGLLVAELSWLAGASHVVAVDPEPKRRELACDLGADAAFPDTDPDLAKWSTSHGHGLGADVAYVCVDSGTALSAALRITRPGGAVVGVGVGDRTGSLSSSPQLETEITLRTSQGYSRSDARRALDLMAADRLRVQLLIQPDVIPLRGLPAAFEEIENNRPPEPKALVRP